jgi:RNA polymerase-binding transcription factor DksA
MIPQSEIDAIRQRLLALLTRLDQDRSDLKDEALRGIGGEASGSLSDVPVHLADLGSHAFEEDLTLDLLQNEERTIEEINAALSRIDEGVFGRCQGCQKAIPRERLDAVPYARYCVACAREREEPLPP